MKAWKLLAVVLAVGLILVGCSGVRVSEKVPVPKDKPLYGFTMDGVFFIHKSLVENAGCQQPVFISEMTGPSSARKMQAKGDYFVFDARKSSRDMRSFMKYKHMKVLYAFGVGKGDWIPKAMKKRKEWIDQNDLNYDVAYAPMFFTKAVENPDV